MRQNPPKDEENAAAHYTLAIKRMKLLPQEDVFLVSNYDNYARRPDIDKAMANNGVKGHVDDARVDRTLPAWKAVFEAVGNGTKLPHLNWNRRWEQGYHLLLPEFASLKGIAKALAVDAESAARNNDHSRALLRLLQIRKMASQIEEEPLLIAFLVGASIRVIADRKAMEMAYYYGEDEKLVGGLRAFLKDESLPDIRPAIRGETYAGVIFIDQMAENPTQMLEDTHMTTDWRDPSSHLFRLLKLGTFRHGAKGKHVERILRAWQEFGEKPDDWETTERALKDLDRWIGQDKTWSGLVASFVTPVFANSGSVVGKIEARRRVGVIVTLLADYKRTNGKWPEKLPDAGKWSIDPFNQKPLGYRLTKEGFVVYSVSDDRKDDGGDLGTGNRDLAAGPFEGRFVQKR